MPALPSWAAWILPAGALPAGALSLAVLMAGCERDSAPEYFATEYFPLRADLEWQYRIEKTVLGETVTQKSIVRSLEAVKTAGRTLYPRASANGKRYRFFVAEQGLYRLAADNETAIPILGFPLREGVAWVAPTRLFLFQLPKTRGDAMRRLSEALLLDCEIGGMNETVDSEAGRFHNCMRVDAVGLLRLPKGMTLGVRVVKVLDTEWRCPGVGLVKKIRREFATPLSYPAEYRQELTGFVRL